MTFDAYCRKWDRPRDNNFALACIEQNTLAELRTAWGALPDDTDMATWQDDLRHGDLAALVCGEGR
jgi:hypothetical protein